MAVIVEIEVVVGLCCSYKDYNLDYIIKIETFLNISIGPIFEVFVFIFKF